MDENSIYDSEVSPKEIIKRMKLNIFQNVETNNNSLINIDYLLYRPSIFSLIKKISNKIGFKSQTYFLSIYYLDILHIKHQKIDLDLKVLSLACLLLAAKYVENDQNVPNLPYFVVIFNSLVEYRDIISIQDLIYAEVLTCKLLEYKLNYYTVYDFDSFFFGHGIIKIEQLKELNQGLVNNNSNNDFNDINFEINENSFYIRKILEKIYRKSRYYLDQVIYNGNICLKYNSLITSVVIMKKSVEDILMKEQKISEYDVKEFKVKSGKYFKEIMNEIYQIDYETMEEYQNLILDNDLINIFQDKNKKISNYLHDTNIKLVKTKRYKENLSNNRYQNVLNQTVDGNVFVKKLNFSQGIDKLKFRRQNESGIETENDNFLYLSRYKKERISVPKRHLLSKKLTDINRFNSTFSNNFGVSKKININKHKEQSERNQLRNTSLNNRRSELNGLINYIHTYTNDFYHKKRKESNSIKKTNIKNINIDDSFDDTKDLMDTMKNNMTLQNENPLNKDMDDKGRNYDKYKKLVLRKRFFNRINMHNRLNEYSISHLDNSNTLQSINTFDEKNPKQNFNRPYSKKVIKNITNYTIKQNSKVTSFYSTMNNNISLTSNTNYNIVVGKGGEVNNGAGGETSAFGLSAAGGSGIGGYTVNSTNYGKGGSNALCGSTFTSGSNAGDGYPAWGNASLEGIYYGAGGGGGSCNYSNSAFSNGTAYLYGGKGGKTGGGNPRAESSSGADGENYTGSGGASGFFCRTCGDSYTNGSRGGSGIVIIETQ